MSRRKTYWLGVGLSAVSGYALILFTWWLVSLCETGNDAVKYVGYPSMFLVPFGMGIVAAYVWKPLGFNKTERFIRSVVIWFVSSLGAAAVFHEGTVCLVIAAPLLWLFIFFGTLAGDAWFRRSRSKLHLSIFPLLLLAIAGDALHPSEKNTVITDELLIHVPPNKVFPFVVQFPPITDAQSHWLNHFGLPEPVQSTSDGAFVGANRQCIFSNGLIFPERITELVPNQKLTFIVTEQPRDPELLGHFFLHSGQFELRDNHDGTTTLIGRSWYTLRVSPNWYFDIWTKDVVRHVHLRVMQHIAHLAEQ